MVKRWALAVPAVLLVIVTGLVAVLQSDALGVWAYVLGAAAAAGALSMVAVATREEPPTETEELNLIRSALKEQQAQLEKRELELMNRLAVYHEWMEFPEPVDLAQAPSDAELAQLAGKDRELQALLAEAAEKLFNDILQNRYAPEGKVSLALIREDAIELTQRVARIYQADADQTLLQTNIEDILRASSRACLQLLTVLDLLPLDVRRLNIEELYSHIRRAVQAYGAYKRAQPYWGYVNNAYLLGRIALGANPISMGAWWVAGRVGQQATQHLTKRYLNRQAMTLVHQAIRVLGYEVASVYGGDFRRRDVNWIYAAELTELIAMLPVSHGCLAHGLREVGSLALRSEYDRVFLYRCVAEGLSARPDQVRAAAVLTPAERQSIVERLERFVNAYGGGASPKKLQRWSEEAEARLEVQLSLDLTGEDPKPVQPAAIARSLMAFLVELKDYEPDAAWETVLEPPRIELTDVERKSLAASWNANPSFFFELPDLPPGGDEARQYLAQLIDLALRDAPREGQVQLVLANATAYLRLEQRDLDKLYLDRGNRLIAERASQTGSKLAAVQIAPVLDLLDDRPDTQFLIGSVQAKQTPAPEGDWDDLVLLGETGTLTAWRIEAGAATQVWEAAAGEIALEKGGYLSRGFTLRGGRWCDAPDVPAELTIRRGAFTRPASSDDYRTLEDWNGSAAEGG